MNISSGGGGVGQLSQDQFFWNSLGVLQSFSICLSIKQLATIATQEMEYLARIIGYYSICG